MNKARFDEIRTVLVIDDDAAMRRWAECALEERGYQVVLARNGRQGTAAYHAIAPDLVLTDLYMPEQDGLGAILELRRDFPHARIVAMSGETRGGPVDFLAMAVRLGADATLLKPFDGDQLDVTLRSVLAVTGRQTQLRAAG